MPKTIGRDAAVDLTDRAVQAASSRSWTMLTRLTEIGIMLGLWTTAAALDLAISAAWGCTWATPVRVAATYSSGFCLSLGAHRFAHRRAGSPSEFSVPRMLAVVLPSGFLLFVIDVIGRAYAHGQSPFSVWPEDFILRTRINWAYFTMMFAFQLTLGWLTASAKALEVRERQLLEARLSALRLQLNPHFLFNTLNAVLTLVEEAGAADAERMLTRLSDFLQMSLEGEPSLMVPLASEIDMVHAYLDIEAVRFGDRLVVAYACDAGLEEAQVPNFILQPLVENAVKHAVARSTDVVTVSIGAARTEDRIVLEVSDDALVHPASKERSGSGVGLHNVVARLEALYGSGAALETRQGRRGYSATVLLPLSLQPAAGLPSAAS